MIARPSATRCCWPPESCEGLRASSGVRPSRSATRARRASRSARRHPAHPQAEQDVLGDDQVREQRVATGTPSRSRALRRRQPRDVAAADQDAARRRRPRGRRSGAASSTCRSPTARAGRAAAGRGREAHVVHRPGGAPPAAQVLDRDRRHGPPRLGPRARRLETELPGRVTRIAAIREAGQRPVGQDVGVALDQRRDQGKLSAGRRSPRARPRAPPWRPRPRRGAGAPRPARRRPARTRAR